MKLPYTEGTLFAVPLHNGGFGIGLVARATKKGKVILAYFFRPKYESIPISSAFNNLNAKNAILALRIGDLSLIDGNWPVNYPL